MEYKSGSVNFLLNIAEKLKPGCFIINSFSQAMEIKSITPVLPGAGYLIRFKNDKPHFYYKEDLLQIIIQHVQKEDIEHHDAGFMDNLRDNSDAETVQSEADDDEDLSHIFKKVRIQHLYEGDKVLRKVSRSPPGKRIGTITQIICDSDGMLLIYNDDLNQQYNDDEITKFVDVVVE